LITSWLLQPIEEIWNPRDYVKSLQGKLFTPKHKMATPFCVFKTLTGFGF
jgi:hypothetical protein